MAFTFKVSLEAERPQQPEDLHLLISSNGDAGESTSISRYQIGFDLGATVIANHPVSPDQDYYFEVKISAEGSSRYVGNSSPS